MTDTYLNKFKIKELTLLTFNHWVVSVRPKQITPGSLVISLKRTCPELNQLEEEETKELAVVFSETESLLKKTFQYDKINYLALMMVDEQVHFHVIPRYEDEVKLDGKSYKDNAWPKPVDIFDTIEDSGIELTVLDTLAKQTEKMELRVGYATGVFDLFHIGHLNILKKAKENCDYLIVGVTTDEVTMQMKTNPPVIPFEERIKIVEGIKYVDKAVAKSTANNMDAWEELKFNIIFKGDDWKDTEKGRRMEEKFKETGVKIVYFPYTQGTSSTKLKEVLEKHISN